MDKVFFWVFVSPNGDIEHEEYRSIKTLGKDFKNARKAVNLVPGAKILVYDLESPEILKYKFMAK